MSSDVHETEDLLRLLLVGAKEVSRCCPLAFELEAELVEAHA